jgi:putative transposase
MIERYSHYGWNKKDICRKWGISIQTFYLLKKENPKPNTPRRIQLNAITQEEKRSVISYALSHTELNHREMSYRMIDEDTAFMSPSSVYRILKENNLLIHRGKRVKPEQWNPHERLTAPDQVWQTDLMVLFYRGKDYYLLSYLDVYSRFVVYQKLLMSMTGDTIREITRQALIETKRKPLVIQSDNGSGYISSEFRSYLSKLEIEHRRIHPHCPNENAEIERFHRTVRELVDPDCAADFEYLNELIKERLHYYNYCRYHSAIGFVTPWLKYNGKAELILEMRKIKLERAKKKRMKINFKRYQEEKLRIKIAA